MKFFNGLVLFAVAFVLFLSGASADKKKGDINSYNKRIGAKFLKEVSEREGIFELKSGMLVEILKTSDKEDAKSPKASDSCDVTYSGTLKDGSKFDAGTTSFAPNQVIKGWTEAMQLMGEGDKWKLYIPYDLAYGERGSPPKIPPFAPLVFEIEIHKVKSGGKPVAEARAAFKEATKVASEL
jgi:FKBP-type peptidyl-prolyl cis-trans isomerase FklB